MLLNIRDITLPFKDPYRYEDESAESRCYQPPKSLPDEGRISLPRLAVGSHVRLLETRIFGRRFLALEWMIWIRHLLMVRSELDVKYEMKSTGMCGLSDEYPPPGNCCSRFCSSFARRCISGD